MDVLLRADVFEDLRPDGDADLARRDQVHGHVVVSEDVEDLDQGARRRRAVRGNIRDAHVPTARGRQVDRERRDRRPPGDGLGLHVLGVIYVAHRNGRVQARTAILTPEDDGAGFVTAIIENTRKAME